jgi:cell division protein FtsB
MGKWFWIAWFLIVLGFAVLSWWGENGFQQTRKLRTQRQGLEKKTLMLRLSNDRLRDEIRLIENDPQFMEWIARDRLGLIGENERLYLFPE